MKPGVMRFETSGSHVSNDKSSVSGTVLQPFNPKYADKVLRANERQLSDIIRSSQRKFHDYMRSTPELRQKYDVK